MIAVPIVLALFGYWVLYAGVKRVSLLDAYRCAATNAATPGPQGAPGQISVQPIPGGPTLRLDTDCTLKKGDTKMPLPGGKYLIWRPIGDGVLGQLNGKLLGPC